MLRDRWLGSRGDLRRAGFGRVPRHEPLQSLGLSLAQALRSERPRSEPVLSTSFVTTARSPRLVSHRVAGIDRGRWPSDSTPALETHADPRRSATGAARELPALARPRLFRSKIRSRRRSGQVCPWLTHRPISSDLVRGLDLVRDSRSRLVRGSRSRRSQSPPPIPPSPDSVASSTLLERPGTGLLSGTRENARDLLTCRDRRGRYYWLGQ